MALGASPLSMAGSIVGSGLALVCTGLALGLVAAFMLSRFTASQLYGVSPNDLVTFVGVPLFLFAASMAALLIPACRAALIELVRYASDRGLVVALSPRLADSRQRSWMYV